MLLAKKHSKIKYSNLQQEKKVGKLEMMGKTSSNKHPGRTVQHLFSNASTIGGHDFSLQQKKGEPTENAEECPVVPVLSAPVSSLQGLHESNPKAPWEDRDDRHGKPLRIWHLHGHGY